MRFRALVPSAAALAAVAGTATAQVKYPAPPAESHVDLRYRIRADRDERVRQYRAMTERLTALGFVADARADDDLDLFDPAAERLAGKMPTANAARLLDDSRIRSVLLTPADAVPGEDAAKPTQVRIELAYGLAPNDQRMLHEQALSQLNRLGFRENVGYDHVGFTRVRGSLPAGRVPLLLKDLRDLPEGWFLSATTRDMLPLPLRNTQPVLRVDVLPDVEGLTALPPSALVGKLTPDLRAVLADPARQSQPLRVEVLTADPITPGAPVFRAALRADLFGATLEGIAGNIATVRLPAGSSAEKLAQRPEVLAVRLPRSGAEMIRPGQPSDWLGALASSRVTELHSRGYTGRGAKVVIVGTGFTTAASLIGNRLPATTRILDLTAEQSPTVEPMPPTPGADATAAAVAAHAAAPGAELVLVRIDPSAFHELLTVGRAVAGIADPSEAVRSRNQDLTDRQDALERRRDIVTEEYRKAFADLSDDDKPMERRAAALAAVKKLQADEQAQKATFDRLRAVRVGLESLNGAAVVVNTVVWPVGVAADGQSELGRLLDEKFTTRPASSLREKVGPPVPTWVQASAEMSSAVWAGPFLDSDGNGVLEFAPPATGRPGGTWTPELNFLAVVGPDGKKSADLPAGAKMRFTIQWREPRTPDVGAIPEPVLTPTLRLVRQLDPTGSKAASDELVEVARSVGLPTPILRSATSAVYEQTLEATVPVAGRYALRVDGRSIYDSPFPALKRTFELAPRIAVQSVDGVPTPVFDTFPGSTAGVGVPGDVRAALTVGSSVNGPTGGGAGVSLLAKPEVVFPATVEIGGKWLGGSGVSAGFVGGVAASLAQAGVIGSNLTRTIGLTPGEPLVLPSAWLQSLSPPRP